MVKRAVLNALRERIEGVFHDLQNTRRNVERLLAKTVIGLTTRLIAKVTTHLFKHILRIHYHIDIQTFQCSSSFTSDGLYFPRENHPTATDGAQRDDFENGTKCRGEWISGESLPLGTYNIVLNAYGVSYRVTWERLDQDYNLIFVRCEDGES